MYHVNDVFGVIGLVSPVELNVYEVCPSDTYLHVRQFFPHGYEPQGWLCCGRDGINSTFYGTNPIFVENDQ